MKQKDLFYFTLFVILFITIFFSFYIIKIRNSQIEYLLDEINISKNRIENMSTIISNLDYSLNQLNYSYMILDDNYKILLKNHNNLEDDYMILKNETDILIEDIIVYKNEIKSSIEWFKSNSKLENMSEEDRIKRELENSCIYVDGENCNIKLGCFYLINKREFNLEYKFDTETSNATDKLQSINDFFLNRGGDCEDYSFFYKAEYNYLLEECKDKNIILESWYRLNSSEELTKHWLNFQKSWYIDEVVNVDFYNYKYPNVVCGNLYDPQKENVSGHCMIAFTKEKIDYIGDLDKLNGSILIEPQNGNYIGMVDDDVYLLNETLYNNHDFISWINVVITDDDYYLFSYDGLKWDSYSNFYNDLVEKEYKIKSYK